MEMEEARTGYSKTIAGILFASIASIFVVVALGVGGIAILSGSGVQPLGVGMPFVDEPTTSEVIAADVDNGIPTYEHEVVSVGENCVTVHDTEQGFIMIDYDVPYQLPLCLNQDELDTWSITAYVYGGYHPTGGMAFVGQMKTQNGGVIAICWHYVGSILITDCDCPLDGCYVDVFVATFHVVGEPIQLASNHLPLVGSSGCCADWLCDGANPSEPLNKWVIMDIVTCWTGCPEPDQAFNLMPIPKKPCE
jgi:hypothetical protein